MRGQQSVSVTSGSAGDYVVGAEFILWSVQMRINSDGHYPRLKEEQTWISALKSDVMYDAEWRRRTSSDDATVLRSSFQRSECMQPYLFVLMDISLPCFRSSLCQLWVSKDTREIAESAFNSVDEINIAIAWWQYLSQWSLPTLAANSCTKNTFWRRSSRNSFLDSPHWLQLNCDFLKTHFNKIVISSEYNNHQFNQFSNRFVERLKQSVKESIKKSTLIIQIYSQLIYHSMSSVNVLK